MKRTASLLSALAAALCFAAAGSQSTLADESTGIVKDLKKLRVAGKVEAVLWTRRQNAYTLQVVFPNMGPYLLFHEAGQQRRDTERATRTGLAAECEWRSHRTEPPVHLQRRTEQEGSDILLCAHHRPRGRCCALMIDDEYFIEPLTDNLRACACAGSSYSASTPPAFRTTRPYGLLPSWKIRKSSSCASRSPISADRLHEIGVLLHSRSVEELGTGRPLNSNVAEAISEIEAVRTDLQTLCSAQLSTPLDRAVNQEAMERAVSEIASDEFDVQG